MAQHKLVRKNHGGKSPVSIKYQNLHHFKRGMISLCQSILKTRQVSHLHCSSLNYNPFKSVGLLRDHFLTHELESWSKYCKQVHKIKLTRFFYGTFYS